MVLVICVIVDFFRKKKILSDLAKKRSKREEWDKNKHNL